MRVLGVAAAIALISAALPGTVLALGSVDQQQVTAVGIGAHWTAGSRVAQTFTAGVTGKLDAVEINADGSGSPATVAIETVSGGDPTFTTLATKGLYLNDSGWTVVAFAAPAQVTKGGHYAIMVTGQNILTWRGNCAASYGGGQALVYDIHTWRTIPGYATFHSYSTVFYCEQDFAFKTLVTAAPKPTAKPTVKPTPAPTAAASPTTAASLQATDSSTPVASPSLTNGPPTSPASSAAVSAPGQTATGNPADSPTPILVGLILVLALALAAVIGVLIRQRRRPAD
jgi:hypothetical protein